MRVIWATALTGVIGEGVKKLLEHTLLRGAAKAEIEQLFSHLEWIAPALAAVGVLILIAGIIEHRRPPTAHERSANSRLTLQQAGWIGIVQGLALPFRGFSRSGATISIGMITGTTKEDAERFSFALAVVLTPAVVALEVLRLWKSSTSRRRAHRPSRLPLIHVSSAWSSRSSPDCSRSNGSAAGWRLAAGIFSACIASPLRPSSMPCTRTAFRRFGYLADHHGMRHMWATRSRIASRISAGLPGFS